MSREYIYYHGQGKGENAEKVIRERLSISKSENEGNMAERRQESGEIIFDGPGEKEKGESCILKSEEKGKNKKEIKHVVRR